MNCKDLNDIAETIGALAALRSDLEHIRDWNDFQYCRKTMLKHLTQAEGLVERVALGTNRSIKPRANA